MQEDSPVVLEGAPVPPAVAREILGARGAGIPLEPSLRRRMERGLDQPLGNVRVHCGPQATELCDRLGARAFTVGHDLFFGPQAYAPDSVAGRLLIAHELVHVVQQRMGRVSGCSAGARGLHAHHALEREADILGARALAGRRVDWRRGSGVPAASSARPPAVVVQRAAAHLVAVANTVPANAALKPRNCHEAVLCWLLYAHFPALQNPHPLSQGLPAAWLSLRNLSDRYGLAGNPQLTGQWIAQNIYNVGFTMAGPPFTVATFSVGDILAFGTVAAPHHSMVVVAKQGVRAFAKGFNNAGLIGGPFMNYDGTSYEITNAARWNAAGQFMGNNGACDVKVMTYGAVTAGLPNILNAPFAGAQF